MKTSFRALILLFPILVIIGCTSAEQKKTMYLEKADKFYAEKQYKEAIIEYRNVLRIDANNVEASRKLALSYYSIEDFGNALQILLTVRHANPDDLDIRLKAARCYFHFGKLKEGREELNVVLEKEPQRLDALFLLAELAKSSEEVSDSLDRLKDVNSATEDRQKYNLALGLLYGKKGDLSTAENYLLEALKGEANLPEAHLALGNIAVARKDFTQAEQEFQAAAELSPEVSAARLRLADFYLFRKDSDRAKQVLENIVQKSPEFSPALYRLARIALENQNLDECKIYLQTVLQKNPSDLEGRLIHAQLLLAQNETAKAARELEEVVKALPDAAFPRFLLGLAYIRSGDVFGAKTSVQKSVDLEPNFMPALLLLAEAQLAHRRISVRTRQLTQSAGKRRRQYRGLHPFAGVGQNCRRD